MLPSFDDYLYAKDKQKPTTTKKQKKQQKNKNKNKYHLILSTDIDDQRTLQSDGSKAQTTSHIQPKEGLSHVTFTWWLSPSTKNQREWVILPRDTDDQRIIQSDWRRATTDHIQSK